jgi:hypothetical protein
MNTMQAEKVVCVHGRLASASELARACSAAAFTHAETLTYRMNTRQAEEVVCMEGWPVPCSSS